MITVYLTCKSYYKEWLSFLILMSLIVLFLGWVVSGITYKHNIIYSENIKNMNIVKTIKSVICINSDNGDIRMYEDAYRYNATNDSTKFYYKKFNNLYGFKDSILISQLER